MLANLRWFDAGFTVRLRIRLLTAALLLTRVVYSYSRRKRDPNDMSEQRVVFEGAPANINQARLRCHAWFCRCMSS